MDNTTVATPQQLLRHLSSAIKERRESLGVKATQEEIAHRARISVRHFQKLESGLSNPKFDTLVAVSKALKTNLQSLLDRAEELASKRDH